MDELENAGTNPLETNVLAKLHSSYAHLSQTEQKIADYVMEHPEKVMYHSVTQMADELEVAQSTITRFCRSIGLRGYQELKIMLARDIHSGNGQEQEQGKLTLPQKLGQLVMGNIQDTLKVLDAEQLQEAVAKLLQARKVVIFGLGESGPMAQLLKSKLLGLGLTADALTDVHLQLISAAHLSENDVAVGISQLGSTKDVVHALKRARKSGAHTICMTGHGRSPISEASDTRLVCLSKGIAVLDKETKSKVSILFLIELIDISIALALSERGDRQQPWKTTESILEKLF
ncbi:MurR/RpiR family transcriptional regulator [Paenibacillus sp. GYB003]|uniref:MurR/RpiR family transcriptional regulator n=1 Tax=Paenibacillus sp. GYB003 TaxID=2994392 RepID=UPI002F9697C8